MESNLMNQLQAFKTHNLKEIRTAGPRYTPSLNPDAPNLRIKELEDTLDALCLSKGFRDRVVELNTTWGKAIKDCSNETKKLFSGKNKSPERLKTLITQLTIAEVEEAKHLIKEIQETIKMIHKVIRKREVELIELERQETTEVAPNSARENIKNSLYQLRSFEDDLRETQEYFQSEVTMGINNNSALLLGEWGKGKTHFLCDYVKRLAKNDHMCVFSLAQNFPLASDPIDAIVQRSGVAKTIIGLMDQLQHFGVSNKCRSLIVIDGINEGDRDKWKLAVGKLRKLINNYSNVALILSCRTPFHNIIFRPRVLKHYYVIEHQGFNEIEFEAQEKFFKYYKIPFPEVPLLSEEFSRPLTLKLICLAIENLSDSKKKRTFAGIASGQKGMTYILEKYIQSLGTSIERKFGLPIKFCWNLLKGMRSSASGQEVGIAVSLARDGKEVLTYEEAIAIINSATHWNSKSKARKFLKELIHSGILFEDYLWNDGHYIDALRLPYQKFSDHIIARHLIEKYLDNSSVSAVKRSFYANRPLGKIFKIIKHGYEYEMPNWAEALMIEFPERIKRLNEENRELVYYLPKNKRRIAPSIEPFLSGLFWRHYSAFNLGTRMIVDQLIKNEELTTKRKVLEVLLSLSIKINHPYEASRLSKFLFKMEMAQRDLLWSEFLRNSHSHNAPYKIISWVTSASQNNISKQVAENCLTILMWFLPSVSKPQRDKATEAIIKLGLVYFDLLFRQTLISLQVNDPYVSERMLAASYGVAMNKWAEKDKQFSESIVSFSKRLFKQMFLPNSLSATHNTIARGSALGCIEIARRIAPHCIANQYVKFLKPPFSHINSPFRNPNEVAQPQIEAIEPGIHMDFENYTVGGLVRGRGNYQFDHAEYQEVLRQIQGRIYDLGFRWNDFEEIDREIGRIGSRSYTDPRKVDRYGKKYSWIAYYEMYGLRRTNNLLDLDKGDIRLPDITIDPSLPRPSFPWEVDLPNLFGIQSDSIADWLQNGPTPNYKNILVIKKIRNIPGPWVLLDGFIEQTNTEDARIIFSFLRGLFIKKNNIGSFKEKFASIDYPGDFKIPSPQKDIYTYAGEIPWSHHHAPYLRLANGNAKPNRDIAFEELRNIGGKAVATSGVPVEIPVHLFNWESYHSVVNDYSGFMVPAPAMSNYLGLNFRRQSVDFFDKRGKQATVYLDYKKSDRYHLLYLRKDLLSQYLAFMNQTMIWAIWGERDVHHDLYQQRNDEAAEYGIYEDHKHIHRTFFEFDEV